MEYLLGTLIGIVLIYGNYKIILTDIREKKIPNKILLLLLIFSPIWYIYAWYYGYFIDVSPLWIIIQTILTLGVSFLIYYYNIWGAGDAKYLLVLSILIPHIGIIVFIGNIAIVVMIYMFLYFLGFWLGKNLWVKESRTSLYKSLYEVQKDTFMSRHGKENTKQLLFNLLKGLNIFLVIFMCLRLIRTHIVDYIRENHGEQVIEIFSSNVGIYIIILILLAMIGVFFVMKKIFQYIQVNFGSKNNIFILTIINILGVSVLTYEYTQHPSEIGEKLLLIFTLYLGIYITFKMLLFAYKLTFISNEESIVHIDNLQPGGIIDEKFLQKILKNNLYLKNKKIDIGTLDFQDIHFLKKFFYDFNTYHAEKKTPNFTKVESVKVIKATAFSGFICMGFVVSYILQDAIFVFIIEYIYHFSHFQR